MSLVLRYLTVTVSAATLLMLTPFSVFAAETPTLEALLPDLPFSAADRPAVAAGKVVTAPVDESSDRELGIAMVLLIKAPIKDRGDVAIADGEQQAGKQIEAIMEKAQKQAAQP